MKTSINYLENEALREPDIEEQRVEKELREKLKIEPIEFKYLPKGWRISSYNIDEKAGIGNIFYSNGNLWLNVLVQKEVDESVFYNQYDENAEKIEAVKNEQEIQIELYKMQDGSYVGTFMKDRSFYSCSSKLPYNEMKNILKYLVILKD